MTTPKDITKWVKPGLVDKSTYYVFELINGKWEQVKKLGGKEYSQHYAKTYGIFFST